MGPLRAAHPLQQVVPLAGSRSHKGMDRAWGLHSSNPCRREPSSIRGSYHGSLPDQGHPMDTARLFQSGRSQAVRLPKEYRFSGSEVVVKHFGNGVLLLPIDDPWQTLEAGLAAFEPGFVITREQPEEQIREAISP